MKLLFAAVVICLASQANANPFSNEVDCEDALAPWSAYGSQSYARGQDYCLQRYDQDRETERRLKALEDRADD
jgi:hypothetical protein